MAAKEFVTRRMAISKSNAQMVIAISVASFVTVFCLIAAKYVWGQNGYQNRVLHAENEASTQLQINKTIYESLNISYNKFVSNSTNILGGQKNSTSNNGGSNSKIILDALPPSYDFPALASSIEGILSSQGLDIGSISGTDNEVSEQSNNSSPNPTPVEMPFSFTVTNTNYQQVGSLLTELQASVRPIAVDSMTVSGGGDSVTLTIDAHTYYQPAKNLGITQKEVL